MHQRDGKEGLHSAANSRINLTVQFLFNSGETSAESTQYLTFSRSQ
jgi:hypothetical protein